MKKFTILKKSAGYTVKSFNDEKTAREYAKKCCEANHNDDYVVCMREAGMLVEL